MSSSTRKPANRTPGEVWLADVFTGLGEPIPAPFDATKVLSTPGVYVVYRLDDGNCYLLISSGKTCERWMGGLSSNHPWPGPGSQPTGNVYRIADYAAHVKHTHSNELCVDMIKTYRAAALRLSATGERELLRHHIPLPTTPPRRVAELGKFGVACDADGRMIIGPVGSAPVYAESGFKVGDDVLAWVLCDSYIGWSHGVNPELAKLAAMLVAADGPDAHKIRDEYPLSEAQHVVGYTRRAPDGTLQNMLAVPPGHPWHDMTRVPNHPDTFGQDANTELMREWVDATLPGDWWVIRHYLVDDTGHDTVSLIPAHAAAAGRIYRDASFAHTALMQMVAEAQAVVTPTMVRLHKAAATYIAALNTWRNVSPDFSLTVEAIVRWAHREVDVHGHAWLPDCSSWTLSAPHPHIYVTWSWGGLDGVIQAPTGTDALVLAAVVLESAALCLRRKDPHSNYLYQGQWHNRFGDAASTRFTKASSRATPPPCSAFTSAAAIPDGTLLWCDDDYGNRFKFSTAYIVPPTPATPPEGCIADHRMWQTRPRAFVVGRVTTSASRVAWRLQVTAVLREMGVAAEIPACMPVVAHLTTYGSTDADATAAAPAATAAETAPGSLRFSDPLRITGKDLTITYTRDGVDTTHKVS